MILLEAHYNVILENVYIVSVFYGIMYAKFPIIMHKLQKIDDLTILSEIVKFK